MITRRVESICLLAALLVTVGLFVLAALRPPAWPAQTHDQVQPYETAFSQCLSSALFDVCVERVSK